MTKRNKCYCQPGLKILIGHKLIDRITLLRLAFEPSLLDIESEFEEDPAFVLTRKDGTDERVYSTNEFFSKLF